MQEYLHPVKQLKCVSCNSVIFNNLNAIFSAVCAGVRASLSIAVSTEIDAIQVLMTISKETVPN